MRPLRFDLVDVVDPDDESSSILRGIRIGEQWELALRLTQGGAPEDISGVQFAFAIRRNRDDLGSLFFGTTESGRIASGGVLGTLVVVLGPVHTFRLPPGRFWYGLSQTSPIKFPRMEGRIDVVGGISR